MGGAVVDTERGGQRGSGRPEGDQLGAVVWAERILETHLGPHLTYHSVAHTRDEVVPAAMTLARSEGLGAVDLDLVVLAAWFHDIGQVVQHRGHEAVGVGIARMVLGHHGFPDGHIDRVAEAIMATRLPQTPTSQLGAIVADADLAVLGQPSFAERNHDLRAEMRMAGHERGAPRWYVDQIEFVTTHRYVTESARARWDEGKRANVDWLRERLAAGADGEPR